MHGFHAHIPPLLAREAEMRCVSSQGIAHASMKCIESTRSWP